MKTLKQIRERCWTGYKPVPGKKPYSKGSCTKEEMELDEAQMQDSGWKKSEPKKDEYGNPVKHVAKHLAKKEIGRAHV